MMSQKVGRRKNGAGSFRFLNSGKVELRFTYKDENGRSCKKSVTGRDSIECIEKANMFLDRESNNTLELDAMATLTEIIEKRLSMDLAMNFLAPQGYSRNISTLRILKKSRLGQMPVVEVADGHIEYYLCSLTRYSNSVIEKAYRQLKLGFNIAVEEGLIPRNPLLNRKFRCPKSSKADKEIRGFSPEEQDIFVKTLKEHNPPQNRNVYKNQLLIELYSGMRMGEINALRAEDIDFEKNVIHVRRTIARGFDYDTFVNEKTKTKNGMRDIPINSKLEEVLVEALENSKKNPEGLLFYDYNRGNVVTTSQVNNFYKRICEKAGLPCHGQHALRHTFASRCVESGIEPIVLKNWLGHSNIHITLDVYADVFDKENNAAVAKLDDYLAD